jgi:hypothetical protein
MRFAGAALLALCLFAVVHDAAAKVEKDVTKLQIGVKVRWRA